MTKEINSVTLNEFSNHLTDFFEQVVRESKPIIVENDQGERAVLKPLGRKLKSRPKTKADLEAFRAAAGSWSEVDVDKFLEENYKSRAISSRPPVEL